ncbi:hypothetical protein RB195_001662 [Necator americanus]|uniref:Uncharacterized protein n=1 Tax=Necator americanus TaxID=51031 RepID=A0ABR1DFD2_NECAM
MQARTVKDDVMGLTETRRRHPVNAAYGAGEDLFLGTCDSRGVGDVGVLVNATEPGQEDVDEEEISDAIFTLNEMNISQCSSYVYQGREINMMNNLTSELGRRKRVAWGAYKSIEDAMKMTKNIRLQAHLFNTTVLFALTYASENWTCRKQEENAISVIERAIERVVLIVSGSTPVKEGIRNSLLRHRSKIRDAANENSLQVLSKQFVDVYWNEDKSRALVRADLDKFKAEHKNQAHVFCYVDEVLPQGS